MGRKQDEPTEGVVGELTPRQALFVSEYLVDLNGKQAAIRAGYSEHTAEVQASRLLSTAKVAAAVTAAQAERAERTRITQDRVLVELARIGFSDLSDFHVGDAGNVVLGEDAPPFAMRAVSSLKRKTRVIPQKDGDPIVEHDVEIRLWDKNAALTNLAKHLGIFTAERVELSGKDGGPIEIEDIRNRLAGRIAGIASRLGASSDPGGSDGAGT